MADSTSKGLFGLFGKKDDEQPSTDVFNNPSNAPAAVPLVTNVRAYYDTTIPDEQGLAPHHHESEPAAVPIQSGGQVEHQMYEQETGYGFGGPAVVTTHETHVDPVMHGQEGGSDFISRLPRSDSSSSYSSHEEGEEGKKKKKKGLKDKIKEKLPKGYKTADKRHHQADGGEKKHGLMDKIKEKLPGHKKEGGH